MTETVTIIKCDMCKEDIKSKEYHRITLIKTSKVSDKKHINYIDLCPKCYTELEKVFCAKRRSN